MNNQKNRRPQYFPVSVLRENLRQQAVELASRLNRSVARLTSCDYLPCEEYSEEVATEYALAQQLFYLQHSRAALEKCIAKRAASVRFRWPDGTVTVTKFTISGLHQVKVVGLLQFPTKKSA